MGHWFDALAKNAYARRPIEEPVAGAPPIVPPGSDRPDDEPGLDEAVTFTRRTVLQAAVAAGVFGGMYTGLLAPGVAVAQSPGGGEDQFGMAYCAGAASCVQRAWRAFDHVTDKTITAYFVGLAGLPTIVGTIPGTLLLLGSASATLGAYATYTYTRDSCINDYCVLASRPQPQPTPQPQPSPSPCPTGTAYCTAIGTSAVCCPPGWVCCSQQAYCVPSGCNCQEVCM
jgi:hypothetical protein